MPILYGDIRDSDRSTADDLHDPIITVRAAAVNRVVGSGLDNGVPQVALTFNGQISTDI